MSSGATPLSRKRTHSFEQGGERSVSDINAKKPRTSSETPATRLRKKRRKKRAVPVVEDIAGSSSTRSHSDGTELMSPPVQHCGDHHRRSRRVVESDEEEDVNIAPWPTPHLEENQKVRCSGTHAMLQYSCFVVTDEYHFHFISSQGQGEGDRARTYPINLQHRRPFEEDGRFEPEARCSDHEIGYSLRIDLFFQRLTHLPNMR